MPDDSREVTRVGGHVAARDPNFVTWRREANETTRGQSHLRRRASVTEILVTLGIMLFALIFICKARGDEISFSPNLTAQTETTSAEIESIESAVSTNSFVILPSDHPHRSVGHCPP